MCVKYKNIYWVMQDLIFISYVHGARSSLGRNILKHELFYGAELLSM